MTANDHELAARLAHEAGELLKEWRSQAGRAAPWVIQQRGDQLAHEFLVGELRRHRPQDVVLSEEGHDNWDLRLGDERVWIVDPLDGTANFGFRSTWAVHVGLSEKGRATVGAVAVPDWGRTFVTDPPETLPGRRPGERRRIAVSWSLEYEEQLFLGNFLDAEVIGKGSAGYKAMMVIRGDADAYFHRYGLSEWDICGPTAVARAAGCVVVDGTGQLPRFNRPSTLTHGFAVCRPDFASELLEFSLPRA